MPDSHATNVDGLLTLTQLREEVEKQCERPIALHQLNYALREYRIEPSRRVGTLRVWTRNSVQSVVSALNRIAANRPERLY